MVTFNDEEPVEMGAGAARGRFARGLLGGVNAPAPSRPAPAPLSVAHRLVPSADSVAPRPAVGKGNFEADKCPTPQEA
jgi:hypothetical protein